MKIIQTSSFLSALCVAALLTGCGSTGVGDILGGGRDTGTTTSGRDNGTYDRYETNDIRGTVERVDTRDRVIIVDSEGTSTRYNLRNGNGNQELALYYDDRTTVEFQGQTYRPEDLERGDRIEVDVEESGSRLIAQQIDVLYDATSGSSNSGTYGTYDGDQDTRNDQELRGVVRSINTRDRTVEIEERLSYGSTGRPDVVTVYYDAGTTVEFQGRQYRPENLEQGDLVEIEMSRVGGRLMAQEILVVDDSRSTR